MRKDRTNSECGSQKAAWGGRKAVIAESGKFATVRRRHERIMKLVREKGFVTIEALSREFGVTPQTIRRDIGTLTATGLIHRYHGGAVPVSSTENVAYSDRKVICLKEKQRIAKMVADHIPEHASLFINLGTTTEEVARALCDHKRLTVITNNLNVASILGGGDKRFEVIITGGLLRHRDSGIIGEAAIDFIKQFKVDYGIIGISGIDEDGTMLDFDYREVKAARAIIENSRNVFLVADNTKFGRNAMVRLGHINEIDEFFTDRKPRKGMKEILSAADVKLHVAGEK